MNARAQVAAVVLLVLTTACNRSLAPGNPTLSPHTGQVASPALTGSSAPPLPTATPLPPPPRASATPGSSGLALDCINGAQFLEDVTVPDGSIVAPGESFVKIWSVRNTGTCDWGPDHRLVGLGDPVLGGPVESALFPARSGAVAEWRLDLQAPASPGEYLGRWQARGPDGTRFGDEVFALIFVELPTPTPTQAPLPTP